MNIVDLLSEKKICLYGFGIYGIRAYFLFKSHGIDVFCYADRDENKKGYSFMGVNCLGYEDALKFDKEDVLLAICNKTPDRIIDEFRRAGFRYVLSLKEIEEYLSKCKVEKNEMISDEDQIIRMKEQIEKLYMSIKTEDNDMVMQILSDI